MSKAPCEAEFFESFVLVFRMHVLHFYDAFVEHDDGTCLVSQNISFEFLSADLRGARVRSVAASASSLEYGLL